MKKLFLKSVLIALAGVGLMAGGAMANLLTNGDFETGNLTGWALMPYTDINEATVQNSPDVLDGYYAALNDSDSDGFASIYQSFYIDPSATLVDVSFDYYFTGTDETAFYSDIFESTFAFKSSDDYSGWLDIFDWDLEINIIESSAGTLDTVVSYSAIYNVTLVDEMPNAVIQFGLYEAGGLWRDGTDTWLGVDNVMVTSNAAPVPEPATMLLFGTGLVGLAGVARRKKK